MKSPKKGVPKDASQEVIDVLERKKMFEAKEAEIRTQLVGPER